MASDPGSRPPQRHLSQQERTSGAAQGPRSAASPSSTGQHASQATDTVRTFDLPGIAQHFRDEAEEDRVHLFRDGVLSIILGALTPLAPLLVLWMLAAFTTRRGYLRTETAQSILTLVAAALAGLFVIALIFAWRQVRPFEAYDRGSQDPRFGRPTIKANEADDETFDDSSGLLGWGYAFFSPSWVSNFLTLGSRQCVQGVRSLVERSRLDEARLTLAATLLARCAGLEGSARAVPGAASGAPAGLRSSSIPDDPRTLHALQFLWAHRYLRSEGVLAKTRLLPSQKGLDLLEEFQPGRQRP